MKTRIWKQGKYILWHGDTCFIWRFVSTWPNFTSPTYFVFIFVCIWIIELLRVDLWQLSHLMIRY